MQAIIEQKLVAAFHPFHLKVVNESHLHAGHAGSPGTGNSHFTVEIGSDGFQGKSKVQVHRMIYEALNEELNNGIHALAIKQVLKK